MNRNDEIQPPDSALSIQDALLAYIAEETPIDNDVILEFAKRSREILSEIGATGIILIDPQMRARYIKLCQFATRNTRVNDFRGRAPFRTDPDSGVYTMKRPHPSGRRRLK